MPYLPLWCATPTAKWTSAGGNPTSLPERELVRADTGERIGATPAWTPDSKRIIFWRKHDETRVATLWSVKPDGSELTSAGFSANVHPLNLEELSVHPDGRHVADSASKTRFEIWTLENFLPKRRPTEEDPQAEASAGRNARRRHAHSVAHRFDGNRWDPLPTGGSITGDR
jgi:hypothetical protein